MLQGNLLDRRSHFHLFLNRLLFLQRPVKAPAADRHPLTSDTCARYSACLAMTSLLGSGRRCHFARAAVALASSLDFLQGTFEKIHLQGLLCQKLLQAMDFLAVSRCVRAGPRRFFSWFHHLQLPAPLVETPRSYPELSR